jgi:hypothetical protein
MTLVLSELTLRELETAPEGVRTLVGQVPEAHIESLPLSSEAEELAAARQIHAYNAVNLKKGYPLLEIRTPLEVPGDE